MLFTKLTIWQRTHSLAIKIYQITKAFPNTELYGVTSQLRRAVTSIPANIVEGHSRKGTKEFINFLSQARSSLAETQYFLILSRDLNYIKSENFEPLAKETEEIGKMINSFINSLRSKL